MPDIFHQAARGTATQCAEVPQTVPLVTISSENLRRLSGMRCMVAIAARGTATQCAEVPQTVPLVTISSENL